MEFHQFDGGDLGLICLPKERDPQEYAMLAAWFSRSTDTVPQMAEKVSASGTGSFMERFYVGYGHESIGDLVDVKLFLHGIPLYLAPLIEHYALFRGQESSTRYIDFGQQRLYGPQQEVMRAQIGEYLRALKFTTDKLLTVNNPTNTVQTNAVKARAFDICRCLIPLGATTNVAWFGDIRSIKGHLAWMLAEHPWSQPWVEHIYTALRTVYPASMERELSALRARQPWVFDEGDGMVTLEGNLDFGSWRDLNRHRVGRHDAFRLPYYTAIMERWYYQMFDLVGFKLDPDLETLTLHHGHDDAGVRLLGHRVNFKYEMPESQAEYFCWRRNQLDVHPTLRLKVQELAGQRAVGREPPFEMVPDVGLGYIERRGTQTITHIANPGREVLGNYAAKQ